MYIYVPAQHEAGERVDVRLDRGVPRRDLVRVRVRVRASAVATFGVACYLPPPTLGTRLEQQLDYLPSTH